MFKRLKEWWFGGDEPLLPVLGSYVSEEGYYEGSDDDTE